MAARLERAEERRATRPLAGLAQRRGLCMRFTRTVVAAATHDLTVAHEDGADQRIGVGMAAARLGQGERLFDVPFVVHDASLYGAQGGRRRGVAACFSRPDYDRRPRSFTWSTSNEARGL